MIHTYLQIHKIIGFAPTLLQVVMTNEIDMPVRQAGKYPVAIFSALYENTNNNTHHILAVI